MAGSEVYLLDAAPQTQKPAFKDAIIRSLDRQGQGRPGYVLRVTQVLEPKQHLHGHM